MRTRELDGVALVHFGDDGAVGVIARANPWPRTLERLVMTRHSIVGSGRRLGVLRTLIDAMAQYERALIRARTKAALRAKLARGERVGAPVFGFDQQPVSKSSTHAHARERGREGPIR